MTSGGAAPAYRVHSTVTRTLQKSRFFGGCAVPMDRSSVAEEARRLVIEEMQALEKEFLRKPPPPIPPEVRSLFLLPRASSGSLGSLDLKEGMRVHRAAVDGVLRSAQPPASTDSPRVSLVDLDAHLLWLKNLVVEFEAYPLLRPLVLHVASYFATLRKNVANRAHTCKFLLRRPSRCTMKLGPLLGFRPREISGFISGLLQGKLDDHNENVVSQRLQAFLDLCNNKFDGSPQLRSLLSSVFLLSAAPGQPGDEEPPRGERFGASSSTLLERTSSGESSSTRTRGAGCKAGGVRCRDGCA